MSDELDIAELRRRAQTAGYRDGLLEVFVAVVLLTIAATWMISPALVGVVAALIVLSGWRVAERVKERVTYPRIGYSRERPDAPRGGALGMLAFFGGGLALMVIAILVSDGLTDASEWRRAAPVLSGIGLAGAFWYTAGRSGLLRHRVIAVLSVIGGALCWWFGSGASYAGVVWHLIGLALPLAAVGAWSLARFVRSIPVRHPLADD